jgi:hypothetical protein
MGATGCGIGIYNDLGGAPGQSKIGTMTQVSNQPVPQFNILGSPLFTFTVGTTYWFSFGCSGLPPLTSACVTRYAGPQVNTYDTQSEAMSPPYWGAPTLGDPVAFVVEGGYQ